MLLDQLTWALAHRIDSVLPRLPHGRTNSFTAETHGSALEIQTGVHGRIDEATEELGALRRELDETLKPLSMRAASAGTHGLAGDRHLGGRALPVRLRLDAGAGAA